jgi:hypothetical protein
MGYLTSLNFAELPGMIAVATLLAGAVMGVEEVLKKYLLKKLTFVQENSWLLTVLCVLLSALVGLGYKRMNPATDWLSAAVIFLVTCFYATGLYKKFKNSDSWIGKLFQSFSAYVKEYIQSHKTKTAVIATIVSALSRYLLKLLKKYVDEDTAQTVADTVSELVETQLENVDVEGVAEGD